MTGAKPEVLFLFNHDAPHQVAHIAGIARALAVMDAPVHIVCATGTPAIAARAADLVGADAARAVEWLDLSLPRWQEAVLSPINRIAPVKRLARLDHHAPRLRQAALIVSAERTCLRLKRRWGGGVMPRFALVPHGAGDRSVSYHPQMADFDLLLLSGPKVVREMAAQGIGTPATRIVVGYPKFDTVDLDRRDRFFANDRPVLLYNPHFDPFLSSWYDEGPALLDWFASEEGQHLNLIFAPHVMLFRKAIHISPEYRTARLRPAIRESWRQSTNILIDIGSERLVDMSYTLAADAYIGDVSSQIYEFLTRPRPAFFIDVFSGKPQSREADYPAWQAGDIVTGAAAMIDRMRHGPPSANPYRARQEAIFADTISFDPARPASMRAALAIVDAMKKRGPDDS